MSDFSISFNAFGGYDNFDDWRAAEKKREKLHKELTSGEPNASFSEHQGMVTETHEL